MKYRSLLLTLGLTLLAACDADTKSVAACGDGFLDPGEECDGAAFSVNTCMDLGYYAQPHGQLTCKADCTFDRTVCEGTCGDGVVQAGQELCDGEGTGAGKYCFGHVCYTGDAVIPCTPSCELDFSVCESLCTGDRCFILRGDFAGSESRILGTQTGFSIVGEVPLLPITDEVLSGNGFTLKVR